MFTLLLSDSKTYELSLQLFPKVIQLSEGIAKIGIGIGAIMLLIVVLYYIISILDGGKFQMKMLVPLLLFLVVCNFSWVAKPVLQFTTTMSTALCNKLTDMKKMVLNPEGFNDISTVNDHYVMNHLENDPTNKSKEEQQADGQDQQGKEAAPTLSNTNSESFSDGIVDKAISRVSEKALSDFATTGNKEVFEKKTSERFSFAGIICQLMSWLCSGFSYCLKIFGIMMTSIVVGFGPITFAFAIMPGRGANIVSWFIRICQFAMFAPLCSFIDTFTACSYSLLQSETSVGWLAVFAITIANIVGLVSVPTIASMIIEGASGAVSLSQGLQTIGGAAMTMGGFLTGSAMMAAGRNNKLTNFMEGMKHRGLVGLHREIEANGGYRGGGISKAFENIGKYGQGALYGWNLQDGAGASEPKPGYHDPTMDDL